MVNKNSTLNIINSNPINVEGTPSLPNIGYYDSSDSNNFLYNILKEHIKKDCTKIDKDSGIYNNTNNIPVKEFSPNPNNVNNLDIPYYLGKAGLLKDELNKLPSINPSNYNNQINYLVCQLINARNRIYNSKNFPLINNYSTVKSVFESLGPSLKIPVALIFVITIYFLVSGFFGSLDVSANIINNIQKNSNYTSMTYWIGILFGLFIPFIIVIITYKNVISTNLNNLEKDDITYDPYGIKYTIPNEERSIDYLTLSLFLLVIFAFIGVLFTIKKSSFNNLIYTFLIGSILFIIAILIYVLYAYIPFFNSADPGKMMQIGPNPLQLFINQKPDNGIEDISIITTNQNQNSLLRSSFLKSFVIIFILTLVFLKLYSGNKEGPKLSFFGSFMKGFLGSSAILIVPILWVINFIIGIQYFYIYPILLILARWFRYIVMTILYATTKDSLKSSFSDDLVKELNNFKDYSAPWGMIGIDELKIILGCFGYENLFSKSIISSNNNSTDISNNKFISSGLLGFFVEKNIVGIIYSIAFAIITAIISFIILFYVVKI